MTSPYDDLVLADRVHGSVYTDPAIFEDEVERIFHGGWVFVGHEGELPSAGDYRTTTLGRKPVIFVRGEDGVVRVSAVHYNTPAEIERLIDCFEQTL